MADVAEGVPPDVGGVQPQFRHVVLDPGFVVVTHLKKCQKCHKGLEEKSNTVKPVYTDHPWNSYFVAVVCRWSLFRGIFMLSGDRYSEMVVGSGFTVRTTTTTF